jgi:hypothetical protein
MKSSHCKEKQVIFYGGLDMTGLMMTVFLLHRGLALGTVDEEVSHSWMKSFYYAVEP